MLRSVPLRKKEPLWTDADWFWTNADGSTGPGGPWGPCAPVAPCGPTGICPALKSLRSSERSRTSAERTAARLISAAPTLLRGSATAAYDVPPSAMKSATSARWFLRT